MSQEKISQVQVWTRPGPGLTLVDPVWSGPGSGPANDWTRPGGPGLGPEKMLWTLDSLCECIYIFKIPPAP